MPTVNIWSHGLGSLGWAALLLHFFYVVAPSYKQATVGDALAVGTLYLSIVVCFVLSSSYATAASCGFRILIQHHSFHIFLNHSPQTWRLASQLDHLGIVLVIWGSSIPADYFGFYCEPHFQRRYWILATSCAAASAYATFQSVFRTPTGRKIRFLLYTALGVSAFVPVVHGIRLHGWAAQNRKMSISYFCGLGVLNFTGAAIYAARIPERWYPGRFDVWGASHQIMHVLVMCGAVSHSLGLVRALEYWVGLKAVGKTCP